MPLDKKDTVNQEIFAAAYFHNLGCTIVVNGCTVKFVHDFIRGNNLFDCLFAYLDNIALPKWCLLSN